MTLHLYNPRPVRGAKRRFCRNEANALYADGLTLEEIGRRYGVTREAIRKVIREDAKEANRSIVNARLKEKREQALAQRTGRKRARIAWYVDAQALRARGLGYREIGKALNVSTMAAWRACNLIRYQSWPSIAARARQTPA